MMVHIYIVAPYMTFLNIWLVKHNGSFTLSNIDLEFVFTKYPEFSFYHLMKMYGYAQYIAPIILH